MASEGWKRGGGRVAHRVASGEGKAGRGRGSKMRFGESTLWSPDFRVSFLLNRPGIAQRGQARPAECQRFPSRAAQVVRPR